MHIESIAYPVSVRPSMDKIVTSLMDRSSPNMDYTFRVSYRRNFYAVRSEVVCAHARPLTDCHLQVFNVWGFVSP